MTFREAVEQVFDVGPPHPDYTDQVGEIRCCGLPVVQRNQTRWECLVCHCVLAMEEDRWTFSVGRKWHWNGKSGAVIGKLNVSRRCSEEGMRQALEERFWDSTTGSESGN